MSGVFCASCGTIMSRQIAFCESCGWQVDKRNQTGAQPSPVVVSHGLRVWHLLVALIVGALLVVTTILVFRSGPTPEIASPNSANAVNPAPSATTQPLQAAKPASNNPVQNAAQKLPESDSAKWLLKASQGDGGSFDDIRHYVIIGGTADSDPKTESKTAAKANAFERCSGVKPWQGWSAEYKGMRPGYSIAVLGGYADLRFAKEVVLWAKRCSHDAYIRTGSWQGMD